jgi:hypothetical protein
MGKIDKLKWSTIENYLERLRMQADVDVNRVREMFNLGRNLCPEKLTDIFISNYIESDGKPQFKDLWLFSDTYVIEVLNFSKAATPKAEMTIFNCNIEYISVEAKNYDFSKTAIADSRLHILVHTLGRFGCDFTAFGHNCDTLKSIFENYIKSNLARGQVSEQ